MTAIYGSLVRMAIEDVLLEAEDKMSKTEQVVQNEFSGVRTGKASPALVENLMVDAYGSQMRLREIAGITTPEPRLIQIQPWDAGMTGAIEKGIQKSNLGLNPAIDGKIVRLTLPELSEERRLELVKVIKKMAENGRIAIRHIRREALEHLKADDKSGGISKDELKVAEKDVQKLTDDYTAKLDDHLNLKEKEIMTV